MTEHSTHQKLIVQFLGIVTLMFFGIMFTLFAMMWIVIIDITFEGN